MDSASLIGLGMENIGMHNVAADIELIKNARIEEGILDEVQSVVLVLNEKLQSVFMNQKLFDMSHESPDDLYGKRLGEIFQCVNVPKGGRCGTSEVCPDCFVLKTILDSINSKSKKHKDVGITTKNYGVFDFSFRVAPYHIEDKEFLVVSLLNIADEKRKQALEHTFFHDISNTLSVISSYSGLILNSDKAEKFMRYAEILNMATKHLINEVSSQRNLMLAESGDLSVQLIQINSIFLIEEVLRFFSEYNKSHSIDIRIDENAKQVDICTDRLLMVRVLVNMIKNAIEASPPGGEVLITCFEEGGSCIFGVNNSGEMPRAVQHNVFQRSYSTKGVGRGIGTYSMKLFGEKYLKGCVWFVSSEKYGTTFYIAIPVDYSYLPMDIVLFDKKSGFH